jgi:hypothetical protein
MPEAMSMASGMPDMASIRSMSFRNGARTAVSPASRARYIPGSMTRVSGLAIRLPARICTVKPPTFRSVGAPRTMARTVAGWASSLA